MPGFGVSWRVNSEPQLPGPGSALCCVFQERPSAPAAVSPRVMALLTHGFLFVIADWWQQLQKQ